MVCVCAAQQISTKGAVCSLLQTWHGEELAELVVGNDSGMYNAGLAGDDAPRAVPSDVRYDGRYGPEGRKNLALHILLRTQGCETFNVPAMYVAIKAFNRELKQWLDGAGSCAYAWKAQASARVDVPTAPMSDSFSCFSQERALNVKVKHGAQLHAQHTSDVHGGPRSVFSLELFVQVLFKPGFPANSPDLNPLHHQAAWQNEVNKVLKERFAGHAKNEMEMKAAVYTAWTQPKRLLMCIYAHVKLALQTELFTTDAPHSEPGNTRAIKHIVSLRLSSHTQQHNNIHTQQHIHTQQSRASPCRALS